MIAWLRVETLETIKHVVGISGQERERSMRDLSTEDTWHLSPETIAGRTVITVVKFGLKSNNVQ